MIREIHFLDITVPEQNLEDLWADLGPFTNPTSKQKTTALFAKKAMWFASKTAALAGGSKLHLVPDVNTYSGNIRRKPLNIMPLFWFEDNVQMGEGLSLPTKDGGGELL